MSKSAAKPLVAMPMGDPSGVGPGLVIRVVAETANRDKTRIVVIGDHDVLQAAAEVVGINVRFAPVASPDELAGLPADAVALYHPEGLSITGHRWGVLDPAFGRAAALCLAAAMDSGWRFDAVAAAPMNKEAFRNAGFDYRDELSYLADLTNSPNTCIAGLAGGIWTVVVTDHIPFTSIATHLSTESILQRIEILDGILTRVSPDNRRVAVAALNPHGGEGGLMGDEEREIIEPAVRKASSAGVNVTGPVPADTVFVSSAEGKFAGVVCLYHDQANIARKLLSRRGGTTLFVGLPIPVATTAHGTAFDIAGTGMAKPDSLRTALSTAIAMAGTPAAGSPGVVQ